jgi:hypothetical protein
MSKISRKDASHIIDDLRSKNGGLTDADREDLEKNKPHILEMITSLRRNLGSSSKM